ncbi:MAG: hypothetical protein FWE09_00040 [Treponema sp.]|nr:hypothetical protein [Treponema sp.]
MTTLGFKIGVDASQALSGFSSMEGAIDKVSAAIVEMERRGGDPAKLIREREALQGIATGRHKDGLRDAAAGLDARIAKETDPKKEGELRFAKEHVQNASLSMDKARSNILRDPGFMRILEKRSNGETLSGREEKKYEQTVDLLAALDRNTEALIEATAKGDVAEISQSAATVSRGAADFAKGAKAQDGPLGKALGPLTKALGPLAALGMLGKAANTAAALYSTHVASLDRSAIVSRYGSGDARGGQIAEMQREADLRSGTADAWLRLLPFFGGAISQAVRARHQAGINVALTDAAYAENWEKLAPNAMRLAALQGDPSDPRGAHARAAAAAQEWGFNGEEGMAAMSEAARAGMDAATAEVLAGRVFSYERATGAERGELSSIAYLSQRHGMGDALGAGWAGLGASNMAAGQMGEFLRGMQRVMEDGIARGFSRSAEDAARSMSTLSIMAGDSSLWKGDAGAQRLARMNEGIAGATSLQSSSDVLMYRAARQILGDGANIVDVMKLIEQGFSGEHGAQLLDNFMALANIAEGGERLGVIHRIMDAFGFNYTEADTFHKGGSVLTAQSLADSRMSDAAGTLPTAASVELEAAKLNVETANIYVQMGQVKFDEFMPSLRETPQGAWAEWDEMLHGAEREAMAADAALVASVEGLTNLPPSVAGLDASVASSANRAAMDMALDRAFDRDDEAAMANRRIIEQAFANQMMPSPMTSQNYLVDRSESRSEAANLLAWFTPAELAELNASGRMSDVAAAGHEQAMLAVLRQLVEEVRLSRNMEVEFVE